MKFLRSVFIVLAIGAVTISTANARDSFSIGINVGGFGNGYYEPVRYYSPPPVVYYGAPAYYYEPVHSYYQAPIVSYRYFGGGHHYNGHHNARHGWGNGYRGHHDGHRGGHRGGNGRGHR